MFFLPGFVGIFPHITLNHRLYIWYLHVPPINHFLKRPLPLQSNSCWDAVACDYGFDRWVQMYGSNLFHARIYICVCVCVWYYVYIYICVCVCMCVYNCICVYGIMMNYVYECTPHIPCLLIKSPMFHWKYCSQAPAGAHELQRFAPGPPEMAGLRGFWGTCHHLLTSVVV